MTRFELCQWVRGFDGYSLDSPPEQVDELARLVNFPGDKPEQSVLIKTNCAMFVCGIWRQCGCAHPLLYSKYHIGMAMDWVMRIAMVSGALKLPSSGVPQAGDVLHYATPTKPRLKPKNDDHVEFLLSDPGANHLALHGGAGRARNGVTVSAEPSDYRVNRGRPLRHWIDSEAVLAYGKPQR